MAIVFLVFVGLAIFHFVYESILLPSIRCDLRYRLFALRDRLRASEGHCRPEEKAAYQTLERSICVTIKYLHKLDLTNIALAQRAVESDPQLGKAIDERIAKINSLAETREINQELVKLSQLIFAANIGGWMYLLPFIVGMVLLAGTWASVRKVISLQDDEINKIVPQGGLLVA